MTENVWICHKGLAGYKTSKTMVTVVAAGVLENNDHYWATPESEFTTSSVCFLLKYTVVIF